MQKEFQLTVDIEKKIPTPSFVVNTLDLKTIKLKITITRGMTLVDLTGITVRMSIRKPDGNVLFQDCQVIDAKGGQVEIVLENQAYVIPGSYSAEIMCFKGSDKVAVTGSFSYRSIKGIMDDKAIESKSEFTAITKQLVDVQATVSDLRENGTGIDAQARQEVEQVSAQLTETSSGIKPNHSVWTEFEQRNINVKWFGAVGDGIKDDTRAFKEAILFSISKNMSLYVPKGTYKVTETLYEQTSTLEAFRLFGEGMNKTIVYIQATDNTPVLKFNKTNRTTTISNIAIKGTGKEIGIVCGDYATKSPFVQGQFTNVLLYNFKIGLDFQCGWIANFTTVRTNFCQTGMKITGNNLNFFGINSEGNEVGIDIDRDKNYNTNVNFYGACVEGNSGIGIKLRKGGDISFFGLYLENNLKGHIMAGTDEGDSIKSLHLSGMNIGYEQPIVIDRVDTFSYKNVGYGRRLASLKITENVKMVDIDPSILNFEQAVLEDEFVEITGKERQSTSPWYQTNFTGVEISNDIGLANGNISIYPRSGNISETNEKVTGNKSVKYNATPGNTFTGIEIRINGTALPDSQFLNLALCFRMPSGISAYRRVVTVNYKNNANENKFKVIYNSNPTVEAFANLLNKYVTTSVPINLKGFKDSTPDLLSITNIVLTLSTNSTQPSTENDWIILDGFEIYKTKYAPDIFTDYKNPMHTPLEISPYITKTSFLSLNPFDSLPAANKSNRGSIILLNGTNGDVAYICKKGVNNTYSWKEITTL